MRLASVLTILAVTIFPSIVNADDAPKRSAELQVLDRLFIGTWKSVLTNKATGKKINTIENRRWSKKGKFVISEDVILSTKKEVHFMITYDPNIKKYPSCYIEESGALVMYGTWNEKTKTMKWSGIDLAGNKITGESRIIDKDHNEWSMTIKNSSGETLADMAAKQTRHKK